MSVKKRCVIRIWTPEWTTRNVRICDMTDWFVLYHSPKRKNYFKDYSEWQPLGWIQFMSLKVTARSTVLSTTSQTFQRSVPLRLTILSVISKAEFSLSTPWRHIGGAHVYLHSILTRHKTEVINITPRPLNPHEEPGYHRTGWWVGPGVGLAVSEKNLLTLLGYEFRIVRPVA